MPSFVRGAVSVLAVAGGLAFAMPAVASAARPTGHVYVDDNTAGTNTIGAFDRHADGTLTPTPGSPFAAGGAGTGATLPSQGAIQRDGRFLLAVDAGKSGTKAECLAYIKEVWTDMRPLSLRRKMEQMGQSA